MTSLALDGAQARLTIDLDALKANWRHLAARAAPAECSAVVKADAYGIGIERAVPALADAGCRTFFVAHLSEGIRARTALRAAGVLHDGNVRIFLLHGLPPGPAVHADMFNHALGPVLGSRPELDVWARETGGRTDRPPSAIQVDTGMNRIGIDPSLVGDLSGTLVEDCGTVLFMSHFISAEEQGNPITTAQIELFDAVRAQIARDVPASLANSSGIFLPQSPHYDLVRPGYALCGGNPCPGRPNPMNGVVTLEAAILQTRSIAAGDSVGYGGRWVAQRSTRLATIGIGYADGLPRGARTVGIGNGPRPLVGGVPCPLVGRVSMDLSIIDVTDAPPGASEPGAAVELIGPTISIDAFGEQCGTIGYEILTSLGRRYQRTYLESVA